MLAFAQGESLAVARMDQLRGIEEETNGSRGQVPSTAEGEAASGVVKWFDPVRGYGFAVADDGQGDILLHHSLIDGHGWRSLPEGARVVVTARHSDRGRQATSLLLVDLTACRNTPEVRRPRPERPEGAAGQWVEATVRWFDRGRGYGFLLSDDGTREAFVHMETLRRSGLGSVATGERLRACLGEGPRGLVALEVEKVAGRR
ncbi:cold-shock protein [Thermaurantiacus sp.]